jgi:hypothetical protein
MVVGKVANHGFHGGGREAGRRGGRLQGIRRFHGNGGHAARDIDQVRDLFHEMIHDGFLRRKIGGQVVGYMIAGRKDRFVDGVRAPGAPETRVQPFPDAVVFLLFPVIGFRIVEDTLYDFIFPVLLWIRHQDFEHKQFHRDAFRQALIGDAIVELQMKFLTQNHAHSAHVQIGVLNQQLRYFVNRTGFHRSFSCFLQFLLETRFVCRAGLCSSVSIAIRNHGSIS